MAYEQKDLTGSLFQNKEKRSENFPDYSGNLKIDGSDWWISGWRKTTKDGRQYLSLSIKRKDGTDARPTPQEFKADVRKHFTEVDDLDTPF